MANGMATRDFKNGAVHWLRYWPVMAFLLVQLVAAVAMAENIRQTVKANSKEISKVTSEVDKRTDNVYSIPRMREDISEIKGDLKNFQYEQRRYNMEQKELLLEIRSAR